MPNSHSTFIQSYIGLIQSPGRGNEATVVPVTGMTSMERRFQLQESGAKIIIRKQTTWSPHISDYLQSGTRENSTLVMSSIRII